MNKLDKLIGDTPLIQLGPKLYAKLETYNPSGSIKDRMASYILNKAIERGELKGKDTIVVASSGNTGIAFSMLSAAHNLNCIVLMPRNMSEERKQMMRFLRCSHYRSRVTMPSRTPFNKEIRWFIILKITGHPGSSAILTTLSVIFALQPRR